MTLPYVRIDETDPVSADRYNDRLVYRILFLSRAQVEGLLDVEVLLDALARALMSFSAGTTSVPPRIAARVPDLGLMGAMVGYVPGAGLEAKLVSVFPQNPQRGRPSHQAVIVLFDEEDGTPLALMDGTYITAIRTGGAAAVAARALAREDAKVLAILGAGAQGGSHLETFPRVRDFAEIRVASRDAAKAAALAARHPRARVATSFEAAVRGADVVACCTDAREPVLRREWLKAGAHVSSVGGTFGPELGADTLAESRVFVEWRGAATNAPPAGACELQGFDVDRLTEVGEVLSGTRPGRQLADELTVYKATGHAVEDVVAARLVYDRARAEGVGIQLPL
jgi:ornithine cyclodeaminase/alanine dehydrogenase-like protein (mu-crystallin family)